MPANIATTLLKSREAENSLYSILGEEETINPLSYTDVPEFEHKEQKAYQSLIIHVRSEEDLNKLSKLLDMPNLLLPGKRSNKTFWYPPLEYGERGQNSLCVWMDENDPEVKKLLENEE
jgi:hypothetical protein